jgi:catechol 2,3-dioxygenase-like lactoylglutathione lyase family enzyme
VLHARSRVGFQTAMFDHVTFTVSDYARSKEFYSRALAPLGISLLTEPEGWGAGFGEGDDAFFWIGSGGEVTRGQLHVAFAADSRDKVDAFHSAALAAGGTDNGAPGLRTIYHPDYYGAFVLDPDGHNIEAVCHLPA